MNTLSERNPIVSADPTPFEADPFEAELAELIVASLHLEITAAEIEPTAPLFGDGLGLDSIDALELALAISRHYGLELKSDDERNGTIFSDLRNLAGYIGAHRTK